jgi:NDP-sugar pyrophosphorylase family protein
MFFDVGSSRWFRMRAYCQRSSTSFDVRACTSRKMALHSRGKQFSYHLNVSCLTNAGRRTAQVQGPCLIGPKTSLASNTSIKNSTIGSNCQIHSHTRILNSFIFENVKIGKSCTLETCIVGKNVVIEEGSTIGRGALLGDGVRIGKGTVIQPFARVGRTPFVKDDDEESDDEEEADRQGGEITLQGRPPQ